MNPSTHECVCFSQEQVQRLRARAEEVIKENERLHDDITKMGGTSQEDWSVKINSSSCSLFISCHVTYGKKQIPFSPVCLLFT